MLVCMSLRDVLWKIKNFNPCLCVLQPLRGKNTVDLIIEGSVLELQDISEPFLYWPVHVIQNIGGRLRLRYAGMSDDHEAQDIWLFYVDVRLRPLGWALENHFSLEPPTGENLKL